MNYCMNKNLWLLLDSKDPADELLWLIFELQLAELKGEKVSGYWTAINFELHQSCGRCTSWATSHLATWTACGWGAPTSTPSSAATRTSSPASSTATLTLTSSSSSFQRRRTKRKAQSCRSYSAAYKYVLAHMYLVNIYVLNISPGHQCCLHCTFSDSISRRQSCLSPVQG